MSKRLLKIVNFFDKNKEYALSDAFEIIEKYKKECAVKFNESVDLEFKMNIDGKKQDQFVKGFCELPHGNGKKCKILVFANDDNINKTLEAGAVYAGAMELIADVESGKISDFDKCIATPSMMPKLAKIAKILGPKGLMPNPKLGTVSENLLPVVQSLLKGRVDIKNDKDGYIKLSIGKIDFDSAKLIDNIKEVYSVIKSLRPAAIKNTYFSGVNIGTTMGMGIKLKLSEIYSL